MTTRRFLTTLAAAGVALALASAPAQAATSKAGSSDWGTPRISTAGLPGVELLFDSGHYPNQPTLDGQFCDGNWPMDNPKPNDGQQWFYAEENSNRLDQYEVTIIVTEWNGRPGAVKAMKDLKQDTGNCRLSPVDLASVSGTPTSFSAKGGGNDAGWAAHSVRKQDRILSVTVSSPKNSADALKIAKALSAKNRALLG